MDHLDQIRHLFDPRYKVDKLVLKSISLIYNHEEKIILWVSIRGWRQLKVMYLKCIVNYSNLTV